MRAWRIQLSRHGPLALVVDVQNFAKTPELPRRQMSLTFGLVQEGRWRGSEFRGQVWRPRLAIAVWSDKIGAFRIANFGFHHYGNNTGFTDDWFPRKSHPTEPGNGSVK